MFKPFKVIHFGKMVIITFKKAYNQHYNSLYYFGVFTTKNLSSSYKYYGFSVFLFFVSFFTTNLIIDFFYANNFRELVVKSSLLIEMIMFQCKIVNFYFKQKQFLQIAKMFDELEIMDENNILKETDKSISKIVKIYFFLRSAFFIGSVSVFLDKSTF